MVKEMHYEEKNIVFVDQYPQLHVTYAPAKFDVATSEYAITRKYIVAQYLRHRVTYAPAKFDIATSHG